MALEIDPTTFYTVIFLLIVSAAVLGKQGGLKVVLWRIRGVEWFMFTLRLPNQNAIRKPTKMREVHGPGRPHFNQKINGQNMTFFTGEADESARVYGAPQWLYDQSDSRPVKWNTTGERFDPAVIHDAFSDQTVQEFNVLKKPPLSKFRWGLMGLAIVLTLVMAGLGAYYAYYFGVNTACAVHAHGVACG